jgi:hypothetical protein
MSARSSISARLMPPAHGQAIYDLMAVERQNTDRIDNIVVMGEYSDGPSPTADCPSRRNHSRCA